MKSSFLKYVEKTLRGLSVKVLEKNQPEIIGITGSNGKSSTKDAVAAVLREKFTVLAPQGNYNTELGVPLTILEQKMPKTSLGWPIKLLKCFFYAHFKKKYYQKLVLELAADKPGDIEYLTRFINPYVSIITNIGPSHLELFKNVHAISLEKQILLKKTKKNGYSLLNSDDSWIKNMSDSLPQKIIWYGRDKKADVWSSNFEQNFTGIKFNIHYKNDSLPIALRGVLGKHLIYPFLAASACGLIYDINLGKAISSLKSLNLSNGRMRIIKGIRNSIIIDDSYNANPSSMIAALSTIKELDQNKIIKGRKIGVLGTMNELGEYQKKGHEEVGERAGQILDILITVGKPANQYLVSKTIEKGLPLANIFKFESSIKAGIFLSKIIKENDIILVKGSQNNIRTEWVVEQIMADKEQAKEQLVRQKSPWRKPKELRRQ